MDFITQESGRLDALIAAQDDDISRSAIAKAIKGGSVTVNGNVAKKPSQKISEGDTISFTNNQQPTTNNSIDPINQNLEVLYEDDSVMVINKPAGLTVHPGHSMDPDEPTLLSGIRYLFEERGIPFSADSVLVHRLDKPTTGCITIAKDSSSYQKLQKQFEDRSVQKQYLAVVSGVPEHGEATIDAPIGRNLTDRTKMSVLRTSVSREAKTSYRVLDSTDDAALLRCDLHTGRTHQIRVHLSSIGHPILGDTGYGSGESKKRSEEYPIENLCLHAERIVFASPAISERIEVIAPLPEKFTNALHAAGLNV
ncbi:MAG: RluA family pseudouridine synthase [Candidatus Peribacteraceae bacterium]|jgi:23S rRNA pseudouridine1911/1915/1917 synthase|nr:RluA family pseudouridine synthase [Candidatus Peribacteraceae bacterium]